MITKFQMTTRAGFCLAAAAGLLALQAGPAAADRTSVRNAKSWSIQLQGDHRSIAKRNSDVAVVDPDEVRNPGSLKKKASGGKRAVLAYISIGEAEEGRGYMKKKGKRWLTKESQGWQGNYKVRFWDEEWKGIVKSRVRAAIAAGYDGVYLDRVDTYESMKAPGGSRTAMIKFVKEISEEARGTRSNAAVAVQNAEELLSDNGYIDTIDAIGKEDLYHGIHHDGRRNNAGAIKSSVANLKKAKNKGKGVYVVEYLDGERAQKVKSEARRDGFVASTGHRKLSQATD
ncbi:MAG: endo alpha-1,4 polygalactosaminidase [Hyphomicrobium sp.]